MCRHTGAHSRRAVLAMLAVAPMTSALSRTAMATSAPARPKESP